MITIISFFFLVLVSGYGYSNIQFPLVEDSLIGKDKICSLTNVEPYYNCSKKWTIFLHDEEFPQICNENIAPGLASHSCTKLVTYDNQVLSADIHLGTEHGAQTEFPFPDGPEFQTILYHELQHAICGCTWHAELVDFI
jgi:hypothetical protein